MKKLPIVAALAAMGLSSQAFGYTATADVQFDWSTDGTHKAWTSSGVNTLASLSNSQYFTTTAGANSTTYYNSDFATPGNTADGGCPVVGSPYQAQYACKTGTTKPLPTNTAGDIGPGPSATGTINVTDTTLTGTLTVINTNDEGAGPQPGTTAATGYNIRSADGSPFKNVWWGYSNTTTLALNLTGTFTATDWDIDGGTMTLTDPNWQCAFADFSGVLCAASTTGGGVQTDGSQLSWGMDQGGAAGGPVTEITVKSSVGGAIIETLSGVLASLNVDGLGNITTATGEWRTASGSTGCGEARAIVWDGTKISCGTLTTGTLNVTGQVEQQAVIPVPAAVWLFGSALGLMGFARRKAAA